jgi:hypothetical protein
MVVGLSERQKELLTGFLMLGIMVGGWGVGEALLRPVQRGKLGTAVDVERSAQFYRDQRTGLRLPVPNSTQGKIQINSHGFRGPEILVPKPPGTIRLAFLGSSTTYDLYVGNASTWPHLVTQAIQAAYPPVQPSWLAQHSELWATIEKNIQVIKLQRAAFLPQGKLTFTYEELAAELRPALEAIAAQVTQDQHLLAIATISEQLRAGQDRQVQQRAADTALYFMPFMSIPGLLTARQYHNEVIADVARVSNAILIEGHEQIPGTPVYYADANHFKPAGSRLMAIRVSSGLLRAPAVRQLFAAHQELCCGS